MGSKFWLFIEPLIKSDEWKMMFDYGRCPESVINLFESFSRTEMSVYVHLEGIRVIKFSNPIDHDTGADRFSVWFETQPGKADMLVG